LLKKGDALTSSRGNRGKKVGEKQKKSPRLEGPCKKKPVRKQPLVETKKAGTKPNGTEPYQMRYFAGTPKLKKQNLSKWKGRPKKQTSLARGGVIYTEGERPKIGACWKRSAAREQRVLTGGREKKKRATRKKWCTCTKRHYSTAPSIQQRGVVKDRVVTSSGLVYDVPRKKNFQGRVGVGGGPKKKLRFEGVWTAKRAEGGQGTSMESFAAKTRGREDSSKEVEGGMQKKRSKKKENGSKSAKTPRNKGDLDVEEGGKKSPQRKGNNWEKKKADQQGRGVGERDSTGISKMGTKSIYPSLLALHLNLTENWEKGKEAKWVSTLPPLLLAGEGVKRGGNGE